MNQERLAEALNEMEDPYLAFAASYREKRRGRAVWVAAAACLCLACAGLLLALHRRAATDAPGVIAAPSPTQEIVVASSQLAAVTLEELVERSALVVSARVTAQSAPIRIRPVNGGDDSLFTDWTLELDTVYRGDAAPGDLVTLRTEGGETAALKVVSEGEPTFAVGDRVLVFLYQTHMGGWYRTEGDYYELYGLAQGAYFWDADGTALTQALSGTRVSAETLTDEIRALSAQYPLDPDWNYRYNLEHTARQLETGAITQEEYDQFWEESRQYAQIITDCVSPK